MRHHHASRRSLTLAAALLCAGVAAGQTTKDKKPLPSPPPRAAPAPRPAYTPQAGRPAPGPMAPGRSYAPAVGAGPAQPARTYPPGAGTAPTQPGPQPNTGYPPRTYAPTPGAMQPRQPAPNTGSTPAPNAPYGSRTYQPRPGTQPPANAGAPVNGFRGNPAGGTAANPAYAGPRPAPRPPVTSTTLNPATSAATVNRMNAQRANMAGVNRRPIPAGTVTQRSNGTYTVAASGGREYHLRPNGSLASVAVGGQVASFHPDGRIATLHTQNLDVIRGPQGNRTVVFQRPDHSTVVSTGLHSGYVQREVVYAGHSYYQRTVLVGSVQYQRVYAGYSFHGVVLQSYVPRYRYAPAFYGYVYYPWAAPVSYTWGWTGAPWYSAYGGYFTPAPSYSAPYDWLTDYSLSQTMANAYAAGQADGAAQQAAQDAGYGQQSGGQYGGQYGAGQSGDGSEAFADPNSAPADAELAAPTDTPISPEIKQALAQQVQQQVAYENAASTAAQPEDASKLTDLPQVLQPNHVFIVSSTLVAATPQEMTCNLSAGDTVQLAEAPAADATAADVVVASSRRSDCPAGVHVALTLDNLAEMQNSFRASLDDGLAALHNQGGKGGLPPAPASAIAAPPRPVEYPPSAQENVAKAIAAANQQGTQAETSVTQAAFTAVAQNQ